MAKLDFPDASFSPWVAPNNVIYTYIGTSPNGYWEANTANAATNLTAVFVERTGSTMTGALKLDNAGNVALPDISFDGDVNTGLYSPGTDSLALVTGGSARLNIDSTGSVVVSGTLTSAGNITASDIIINSAGTAAAPSYRFGLGTGFFSSTGTGSVSISTNSTERFTIDSSGNALFTHPVTSNAGINVSHSSAASSSIQAFGVYAAGVNTSYIKTDGTALFGASISLQGSGAQCALSVDGDDLAFKTINSSGGAFQEGMRIIGGAGAGNVGIGTTSPEYIFDARGSINISGSIFRRGADNTTFSITNRAAQPLVFGTNDTERMRIDSSGKVGVGTSSPQNIIHADSSGATPAYFQSTNASSGSGATDGVVMGLGSATDVYYWNYENGSQIWATNAAERMRISSTGRLGIGTSAPTHTLHVVGDYIKFTAANAALGTIYIGAETNVNSIYSQDSAGNAEDFRFMSGSSEYARITGNGYFHASPNASYYGNLSSGFHSFDQVTNQWSAGIRSTGGTPYGLLLQYSGASPNSASSHFIYASDASAFRFGVMSNGGISNYSGNNTNLCDEREKKNIVSLETKWDKVKNWELRKFHYNDDVDTDDLRYGVIAQEVETENPELITAFIKQLAEDAILDEDGTVVTPAKEEILRKGVKEQQMMWMAIKALQEAMAKIETLETKVAALEAG